ncbi:MAG TPA: inorganic diphosphatase [Balneolaceae bacterium]|nr:inorganic diphosphatase [Balneolaceae bacterium]
MMSHPWHEVTVGKQAPESVNTIIEIPKGTRAKYELDKESGLLKLDRVLYSSFYYPANYGFIPQTLGEDQDPLDILVLSQIDFEPLCLVQADVIGVMRMLDSGEADDKIIAVASNDMSVNSMQDVDDLNKPFIQEMEHFFEEYKRLENEKVSVDDFQQREVALQIIEDSIELYNEVYNEE